MIPNDSADKVTNKKGKIKENFVFLAVNRTFATRTSKKTTRYEVHF
jgi:hypothetical protein